MATIRQQIVELLATEPRTVRDLATALGLRISETVDHLRHVRRSLGDGLEVSVATCQRCGFAVRRDQRFTAPSRCPRCRSERVSEPVLRVRH